MDKVYIRGMEFYAYHGVYPEENRLGQRFLVDVELSLPLKKAGETDEPDHTVNYAEVYRWIKEVMEEAPVKLLETLAERICRKIFMEDGKVERIFIDVRKTDPPIPGHYKEVGVQVERYRHE